MWSDLGVVDNSTGLSAESRTVPRHERRMEFTGPFPPRFEPRFRSPVGRGRRGDRVRPGGVVMGARRRGPASRGRRVVTALAVIGLGLGLGGCTGNLVVDPGPSTAGAAIADVPPTGPEE